MFEILKVLRIVQIRQPSFYINPGVGIAALPLGQHARILDVALSLIVGRQRQPGQFRLFDVRRQLFFDQLQIFRASHDALACIEPVFNIHAVGCCFGEHHHAAHVGEGGGQRIPM